MTISRSRKWQLTQNNPTDHDMNHHYIDLALSYLKPVYYCMCDETGEEGTYHTHLYVQFSNAINFTTMKNLFPFAHIEAAQGSAKENRDYVRKEGKYLNSEKKTTNHIETFKEYGEMPEEKQGKRTDIEDIFEMIKDGYSPLEIMEKHPQFMNRPNAYNFVRSEQMKAASNKWRNVFVTYIYGDTGAGKNTYVTEACGGYEGYYRVTDYQHPFDSYDGQETIMFDEFRSSLPISDMLCYLDGHPIELPCRYHNKTALWTNVYIVSNIPLKSQYLCADVDRQTLKALERRIHKVLHFRINSDPEEEEVTLI